MVINTRVKQRHIVFSLIIICLIGNTLFSQQLRMGFISVNSMKEVKKLAQMGFDIADVRSSKTADGTIESIRVEAVLSLKDEMKLDREDFEWSYAHVTQTRASRHSTRSDDPTSTVYHSFDEPEQGIKDQLQKINSEYPHLTRLHTIGHSVQGRPLLAMSVTKKHHLHKHSRQKPEVLFLATHHAREWVATQMAMRLIKYLTSNYGKDKRITTLLRNTNIWIIPVANPDGYEYTFTHERLWRKNLSDNNGDQIISLVDGVDLNRNFDSHWGLDNEGSSVDPSSNTFRGPEPNSEPETQAVIDFISSRKNRIKFVISYHTYGDLILYPWGWQVKTPSYDDPIFVSQAGTDDNPAIWDNLLNQGYDPGVAADLYITNGDFGDWCYEKKRIPTYIVELTDGVDKEGNFYGFEFPDDEDMVQTVFEDNLEFVLGVAESAKRPSSPVSPVGIKTNIAYHEPIKESFGRNQIIEIVAKKHSHPILIYRNNNGYYRFSYLRPETGKNYNTKQGKYYGKYQAVVHNQRKGDQVRYWIWVGRKLMGPYSYEVMKVTDNKILIVSAEDYSGEKPPYTPNDAPHYLGYYTDALDAAGYSYDIWDITKEKAAPSYIEVLSHYDIALWYTGNDIYPTVPDSTVYEDAVLNFRDFLNYGNGKLLATGQDIAFLSSVSGKFSDDFFQYTLGAYMHFRDGGMDPDLGIPFDVKGKDNDPIFHGLTLKLHGGTGAQNQTHASSFLLTNNFLPHYKNSLAATYIRPGGPFDPVSGQYYVYSQMSDNSYKRLGRSVTLPAGSSKLSFWASYDMESDWDYAFVEIREVGMDNWTTLPDLNGITSTNTGSSCQSGWVEQLHPFLAHYMDDACNPTGTTGAWNAISGSSGGWKRIEMDLSAYADKEVEIYITYASDWGTQNLGFFIDDIEITGLPVETFENGLEQWSVSSAPGSSALNNWNHMSGAGFPEGPAIRTKNTVYLGFGFEAIDNDQDRNTVMKRIIRYFKKGKHK